MPRKGHRGVESRQAFRDRRDDFVVRKNAPAGRQPLHGCRVHRRGELELQPRAVESEIDAVVRAGEGSRGLFADEDTSSMVAEQRAEVTRRREAAAVDQYVQRAGEPVPRGPDRFQIGVSRGIHAEVGALFRNEPREEECRAVRVAAAIAAEVEDEVPDARRGDRIEKAIGEGLELPPARGVIEIE